MKPYGYKKHRKPPGDGCRLCMKGMSWTTRSSKTRNRRKVKEELSNEIRDTNRRGKKEVL